MLCGSDRHAVLRCRFHVALTFGAFLSFIFVFLSTCMLYTDYAVSTLLQF